MLFVLALLGADPVGIGVEIGEKHVRVGRGVDFCDKNAVHVGEELPKHTVPADDETAVILLCQLERLLGRVRDLGALNRNGLARDDDVVPSLEGAAAGEIPERLAPDDDGGALRQIAKVLAIRRDDQRLRALRADAPVGIDRNDASI